MASKTKRAKLQLERGDRISALPDLLIQHILSFLPTTKEAIRTSILSKRWHNQWTRVPVLIFDNSDMSGQKFSRFIDNTLLLHDCSKIHKLHIRSDLHYIVDDVCNFISNLCFAMERDVEELVLELVEHYHAELFMFPDFLFDRASLVKLKLHSCCKIVPVGSVRWEHLKVLSIEYSSLSEQAIGKILSGSPVLESLEIKHCFGFDGLFIVSNSLKKLVIIFGWEYTSGDGIYGFQISCGRLKELRLSGSFNFHDTVEFKDLSSLSCAILDFDCHCCGSVGSLLQQLQHVEELNFGSNFISLLSNLEDIDDNRNLSSLLLNNNP